jgi:hypothetical protein
MVRGPSLEANKRNSQHFMKAQGLLHCLQESATGLYPEPNESNPTQILLL